MKGRGDGLLSNYLLINYKVYKIEEIEEIVNVNLLNEIGEVDKVEKGKGQMSRPIDHWQCHILSFCKRGRWRVKLVLSCCIASMLFAERSEESN